MNLEKLHAKLINSARSDTPSDRVPFAFETRIMARLAACAVRDPWALWAAGLWRATAPCVGIMLLLGAWTWFTPASPPSANDLSQDLENTVLVAADQESPSEPLW